MQWLLWIILGLNIGSFKSIHQIEWLHYREVFKDSFPVWQKEAEELRGRLNFYKAPSKGMYKWFYGFLPYWVDASYYSYFRFDLLTHIAYFSVGLNTDGSLGAIPNPSYFSQIKQMANARGIKIHITFTLFGSSDVSAFLDNMTARGSAISNILQFVRDYDLDGVNIDFEYVLSSRRDSFTHFIEELADSLHNSMDRRKEIVVCGPAVPEWYPGYDVYQLSQNVDAIFIMAYDYHWSGASEAGPVAPTVPSTFWGQYSVAKTIGSYKNVYNVSGEKLILGVPYYGYKWPTASGDMGSSTTGSGNAVIYYYATSQAQSYGRLWDTFSLTPWYKYLNGTQWYQTWYDDTASLRLKFQITIDSALLGAGCWALGYEHELQDIWNTIADVLDLELPEHHFIVEVNTAGLNIREGPSVNYPVVSYAVEGTKLVGFKVKNNWYKVYIPPQLMIGTDTTYPKYGWMYGGNGIDVKYLKAGEGTIAKITASVLNVRTGPTTDSQIIARVVKNQSFVIDSFNEDSTWARIYLPYINDHTKGWIYLGYALLYSEIDTANEFNVRIDSVVYPPETCAGDTFEVKVYLYNEGYVPLNNEIVFKKLTGNSLFYLPEYWQDSSTVLITDLFPALPYQYGYVSLKFKAPSLDTTLTDTFYPVFHSQICYHPVIVSVHTGMFESSEINSSPKIRFKGRRLYIPVVYLPASFELYDIIGRRILERKVMKPILNLNHLKAGVYVGKLKSENGKAQKIKFVVIK